MCTILESSSLPESRSKVLQLHPSCHFSPFSENIGEVCVHPSVTTPNVPQKPLAFQKQSEQPFVLQHPPLRSDQSIFNNAKPSLSAPKLFKGHAKFPPVGPHHSQLFPSSFQIAPRKTEMTLSDAALAGIVVGAILIFTSVFGVMLYRKRRHNHSASPKYISPSSPAAPGSPTLSPPPLTGIKKRVHDNHGRYPSLENGPGPTFVTRSARAPRSFNSQNSTDLSNLSTVDGPATSGRAVLSDPMTTTSLDAERRPDTAVSTRPGSLHQAVLDIGEKEAQTGVTGAIEEEFEKAKTEEASTERSRDAKLRPKGYSGAWP